MHNRQKISKKIRYFNGESTVANIVSRHTGKKIGEDDVKLTGKSTNWHSQWVEYEVATPKLTYTYRFHIEYDRDGFFVYELTW